jgi:hypothetical protein
LSISSSSSEKTLRAWNMLSSNLPWKYRGI